MDVGMLDAALQAQFAMMEFERLGYLFASGIDGCDRNSADRVTVRGRLYAAGKQTALAVGADDGRVYRPIRLYGLRPLLDDSVAGLRAGQTNSGA